MTTARRILVVDDSELIHAAARIGLEAVGWEVAACADGHSAVERVADERPDAVLLDVVMPGLDGPATLSALRRDVRTRDVPVAFMTGRTDPRDRERLLAGGARAIIAKPFEVASLAADVRRAFGWPG